jgi:hypothetical protein
VSDETVAAGVDAPGRAPRLRDLGRRPLLAVKGINFTWDDVLAWDEARGTLAGFQERTRSGVARFRRAAQTGSRPRADAVSTAAAGFRYGRNLLAADQLSAWLARWELTVAEWGEYIERSLLLDDATAAADEPALRDGDVAEAEYVDLVCSGFLEEEALAFASDIALADLTPIEAVGDQRVMVERALLGAAVARRNATSEPAVEYEIARHGLDWTRLDLAVLELEDAGAAREAAMCIRVDGSDISDVAAAADAAVSHMSVYLGDLEPWLQPPLLAAQPGELVGPVHEDGQFVLLAVNDRKPAGPTDPELRRRAESALVDRAVRRATESRVRWHEHL